ncbi:MAG: glycoside hydrolase, partial [Polaribacter sp.]|nr:glycoside hydrolase [Polaribacter sp.]
MSIKKQFLKSKPVCKVTFTVPAEEANNNALGK